MKVDEWKEWQREAYIGLHDSFDLRPALDARGYQYIPAYATIRPCSPFDMPAPQVEFWIPKKQVKRTLWERFLDWLRR